MTVVARSDYGGDRASTFASNLVRVLVVGENGESVQLSDGTWASVPLGSVMPEDAGWRIPRAAVEPLREAILAWQGKSSDAPTEVRVLREWLEAERQMVRWLLERSGGTNG